MRKKEIIELTKMLGMCLGFATVGAGIIGTGVERPVEKPITETIPSCTLIKALPKRVRIDGNTGSEYVKETSYAVVTPKYKLVEFRGIGAEKYTGPTPLKVDLETTSGRVRSHWEYGEERTKKSYRMSLPKGKVIRGE